jgi:hypothetical protein
VLPASVTDSGAVAFSAPGLPRQSTLKQRVDVFRPRERDNLVPSKLAPFDTEAIGVSSDDFTCEACRARAPISPAAKLNPDAREQRDR